jgi:aerobic-type carbon monoxide dehydrogenase small subunit (CoxS/CutS family)
MTLAIECDGNTIETAESLRETAHPLVEAYVKHHAMQCGYCTPGFIMTAKSLLDKNSRPSEEQIRQALAGNLCRCGTYPQHLKAVLAAAEELGEKRQE